MKKTIFLSVVMTLGSLSGALAQFAQPVPSNDSPGLYGPGRIGANVIASNPNGYRGRMVDACGRVQIAAVPGALALGNNLRVYLPQDMNPRDYDAQVVCARGMVDLESYQGAVVPTIYAQSPRDVAVIGGTGPYAPRASQQNEGRQGCPCPTGQMLQNGTCVARWRADYGGHCL
jgi:hypothetical protein